MYFIWIFLFFRSEDEANNFFLIITNVTASYSLRETQTISIIWNCLWISLPKQFHEMLLATDEKIIIYITIQTGAVMCCADDVLCVCRQSLPYKTANNWSVDFVVQRIKLDVKICVGKLNWLNCSFLEWIIISALVIRLKKKMFYLNNWKRYRTHGEKNSNQINTDILEIVSSFIIAAFFSVLIPWFYVHCSMLKLVCFKGSSGGNHDSNEKSHFWYSNKWVRGNER